MLDQAALIARFANAISRDRDSVSRVLAYQSKATETLLKQPEEALRVSNDAADCERKEVA